MKIKSLVAIIVLFASGNVLAQQNLQHSMQMILVTTPDWNASTGTLQRYERNSLKQHWEKIGETIPVVIGKNGMAWGVEIKNKFDHAGVKQEGDGRTPAGVYEIGPGFGFDKKSIGHLDYFPITDSSVCVDDPHSQYYNQLIDQAKVTSVDWHSGEQMHQVPGYQMGSVIQYNTQHHIIGAGSCIFMHIWKSANTGTAGCVAMDDRNLKTVLHWLNSRKQPMMVTVVRSEYHTLQEEWQLPEIQ